MNLGLRIGFAKAAAASPPPPPPAANITYDAGNAANGTLTLSGNTSTGISAYAWSLAFLTPEEGGPGGLNPNAEDFGGDWAGNGANPGAANGVTPTVCDFTLSPFNTPLGPFTVTLTGDSLYTDTLYGIKLGGGTLTLSDTQDGAITGAPTGNAAVDGSDVNVTDLAAPSGATHTVVYLVLDADDSYVDGGVVPSNESTISFTGLAPETYKVMAWGVGQGRCGNGTDIAAGLVVSE